MGARRGGGEESFPDLAFPPCAQRSFLARLSVLRSSLPPASSYCSTARTGRPLGEPLKTGALWHTSHDCVAELESQLFIHLDREEVAPRL